MFGNQPIFYMAPETVTECVSEQVAVLDSEVVELMPSDISRAFFVIHNEEGVLYIRFGEFDVNKQEYTYRLTKNCTLENSTWRGRVTAIKDTGDSIIQLTVNKRGY